MRATKIESVQALRAFAALSVAILHVLHNTIPLDASGQVRQWHDALPWASGVDLFFVISGFVMVYASADLFGRRSSPPAFMARRLIRIVPLYWAATTLFLVAALATPDSVSQGGLGIADVVMSYTFIPARRPDGSIQPIYSLGWTLNYEMFFYVVFAACLALRRHRAVAAVALLLGAAMALHRFVPPWATALVFWTDGIMLEFLFGMAVAVVAAKGVAFPAVVRLGLTLVALTLLIAAYRFGIAGGPLVTGAPMALLVAAAVLGHPIRVPGALLLLGDASYALYLVHPFAMRPVGLVWQHFHLSGLIAATLCAATALLLANIGAICVHLWFERPVGAWLRSRLPNHLLRRERAAARRPTPPSPVTRVPPRAPTRSSVPSWTD
jgi:peptidoglycan/LPS O-acetylase OafA/YrhL